MTVPTRRSDLPKWFWDQGYRVGAEVGVFRGEFTRMLLAAGNGSRRARIAKGSGTQVQDVNRLLKQSAEMQKMMKMMKGGKAKNLGRMLGGLR